VQFGGHSLNHAPRLTWLEALPGKRAAQEIRDPEQIAADGQGSDEYAFAGNPDRSSSSLRKRPQPLKPQALACAAPDVRASFAGAATMVKAMRTEREPFSALVQVKAPPSFATALDKAAASRFMSRSDFIRTTLADRLKADRAELPEAAA
jgi:hypothetical protein